MEYETFYDEVKVFGGGVLRITIPRKLCQFAGIKQGDQVKVMIQKLEEEDE